jgi:hypothetical protein
VIQRLQLLHHEAEAGDVEVRGPIAADPFLGHRGHGAHEADPEKEVDDVAELGAQQGRALEDDGQRGNGHDGRRQEQQVLAREDERFQRGLAAHDDHGHGRGHEAEREEREEDDVAGELAGDVLAGTHGGRRDYETAAREHVPLHGVGDHVEAEQADEHRGQDSRGHADGRGVVESALAADVDERSSCRRIGNPHVGNHRQEHEHHRGRWAAQTDHDVGANDGG